MTNWDVWAQGVLQGISAPVDQPNIDTLWAWSNKESGSDVMRWNNPLNTTEVWFNSTAMNSVGVQSYRSVTDGVGATVATLVNGHYPIILANLRGSVPRAQWGNACPNLGTWGTGCSWLTQDYGAYSGSLGDVMTDEQNQLLVAIYNALFGGHSPADIAAGNSRITDLEAQVAALKAANPAAEPKTISLTITGTGSGTLS